MTNQRNMRKWVDALRSGRFAQGPGALRTNTGLWCCLGVACQLAAESDDKLDQPNLRMPDTNYSYGGQLAYLPVSVVDWLGLDDAVRESHASDENDKTSFGYDIALHHEGEIWGAAEMNDDHISFGAIAAAIEKKYLAVEGAVAA